MRGHKSTKVPNVRLRAVPATAPAVTDRTRDKGKRRAVEDDVPLDEPSHPAGPEEKPLAGKTVCISGYRDIRADLTLRARELGAVVSPGLTDDTHYLISEAIDESAKVKAARENRIHVVLAGFVNALYDAWSLGESVDAARVLEQHMAFATPKPLDGLHIAITAYPLAPPHVRADTAKLINDHGGLYQRSYTKKVDVLLIGDEFPDDEIDKSQKVRITREWRQADDRASLPIMVWSEWLADSVAGRRPMPYEHYDPDRPRPRAKLSDSDSHRTVQAGPSNGSTDSHCAPKRQTGDDADEAVEAVATKKRVRGDRSLNLDDLLLRKVCENSLSQTATAVPRTLSTEDAAQNPMRDTTPSRAPQELTAGGAAVSPAKSALHRHLGRASTLPASISSSARKPIFAGLVISQRGLQSDFVPKVRSTVTLNGGRYRDDPESPDVNRIVIPFANPSLEIDIDDPRNVSIYWLERCLFQQEPIARGNHWSTQSFRFKSPIPEASQYTIISSGFDSCDGKLIQRICNALGVSHVTDLREATHCVSAGEGAVKAKQAVQLGIPVVDIEWLLDLMRSHPLIKPETRARSDVLKGTITSIDVPQSGASQALLGCTVAISSKLNAQRTQFSELIVQLGGTVGASKDDGITHLLYAAPRVNDAVREIKHAREMKQFVCHPAWLEACCKAGRRVDESCYPPTLAAERALVYTTRQNSPSTLPQCSSSRPTISASSDKGISGAHAHVAALRAASIARLDANKPNILDDPAFAAAPSPPPLALSPRSPPRPHRSPSAKQSDGPIPGDELVPDDDSVMRVADSSSSMALAPALAAAMMNRSVSAPGSMSSSNDSSLVLAALLRKNRPEGSVTSINRSRDELASFKARRKERHLARKRSSATAAPSDDHLLRRLPAATVKDTDLMEIDDDTGLQGESLLVSYVDPNQQAARQQLQGAFARAKTALSGVILEE